MYKKSSANAQHRVFSHAVHDRSNTGGIDPDALHDDEFERKREELVERKRQLGLTSSKLLVQIKIANDRYRRNQPGQLAFAQYERMLTERTNIVAEITDIEGRLRKLKAERRRRSMPDNLSAAFMHMAKEMLAQPVFSRIYIAALHRVQGDDDER